MPRVSGRWIGRLVDAGGYEGSLALELRQRKDSVRGGFEVQLATQHGEPVQAGAVEGELKKDRLTLRFVPGKDSESGAEVELVGDVFECVGGVGMKGVYEVSPRKYSPLIGGVIAASTEDVSALDTLVENREVR